MSTKKLQILDHNFHKIYMQADEPIDAPDGALWVDTDEETQGSGISYVGGNITSFDDGSGNVTLKLSDGIIVSDNGDGNITIS